MKEKIIIFLIGLLLGAIISTSSIYIYTIANNKNSYESNMQIPNNTMNNHEDRPHDMPSNEPNNNSNSNRGENE